VSDEASILDFPDRPGGVDPDLVHAVEAMLFAAGEPVSAPQLSAILEVTTSEIVQAIRVLAQWRANSGLVVERIAGGWQLRTSPRFTRVIQALRGAAPKRLSKAALEVLAAVAYEQPCTRTDVEALRGVDSGAVLKMLLDRGLVRVAGRATIPGRPLLYRTTSSFLELFSLPDLSALPTLAERAELARDEVGELVVPPALDDAPSQPALPRLPPLPPLPALPPLRELLADEE
jgi:segregation and condensation protein B